MNKKNNTSWKVIKYMLGEAAANKPQLFVCYFVFLVVEVLRKIQMIIIPKFIIDELVKVYNGESVQEHLSAIIFYIGLLLIIMFTANLLRSIADRVRGCAGEWFNEYFQVKINEQTMSLDYECTEDPAVLDQMNKAKEGMDWYSGNVCGILDQFFDIITKAVVFFGVVAVIFTVSPLIIPLEIISISLISVFNKKIQRLEIKSFQNLSKSNRIFGYLFFEIADFSYGKDVRLYNSSKLLDEQAAGHLDNQMEIWTEQAEGTKKQQYTINLIDALTNGLTYLYIGYEAVKKIISIGDFSMAVASASTFGDCCQSIVRDIQEILKRSNYANEYLKYLEYPRIQHVGKEKVKDQNEHEIEFKNVSFKYPRSETFTLKNINIRIPFGQHLAVVGLNGAGKTTFIKLLCRLYDVTEGEVLIDGINIKDYQKDEYRKLLSVLFQDFKLFAF